MARYRYEALTAGGDLVQGEMEAADESAIVARLQEAGQLPLRAEPAGKARFGGLFQRRTGRWTAARVARRELGVFTRELGSLLHAGLPLDRALQIILDVTQDSGMRRLVRSLQEAVRAGQALSDAMQAHESEFSGFHVSMIRAAEAAGRIDEGLARLAQFEERSKALRDSVLSALVYPAILVSVAAISLLVILGYVVPQFSPLFADSGRALPLPTQAVIAASGLLRNDGWLLAVAAAGLVLFARTQLASATGKYRVDSLVLRVPLVGELIRRIEMARFSRSLATLLASGVPLVKALSIARGIVSNRLFSDALELAADGLKAGRGLADPLASTGLFPALGLQMLKVGEETGRLDEMLERVAELYDREVASATQRMLVLLEPLLIVGLGVLIAGVVISILLAMVSINDLPL